jgi:hypothetical protein
MLTSNKHSNLLGQFPSYEENEAPSLASFLHLSMLTQLDLNLASIQKCHPIFLDFDASNPGPEVLRRQQAVRLRQARPGLHPGLRIIFFSGLEALIRLVYFEFKTVRSNTLKIPFKKTLSASNSYNSVNTLNNNLQRWKVMNKAALTFD